MGDERKMKKITKAIAERKRRVARSLGKTIEKRQHLFSILVPVFSGLIFLLLAIMNLKSSIWFDEAYSAYLVRGDFGQIWEMTAMDVHPPFFYFALKIWSSIFGTSDVAMRFMSVFFGLIAIVFIFQTVKKMFGIKAASLSTLFVAISPMFIRYAQEMRMYTMVLAIVFAATYFLMLALEKGKEKAGRKYWFIYALLICMGMWTHYFSAFAWIAHVVIILVHFGGFKKIFKDKKLFKTLLFTYGFAVLLYLPWIPSFFKQIVTVQSGFWIPPVSFEVMADLVSAILFFNLSADVTSWGWVFGTALIVFFILTFKGVFSKASKKERPMLRNLLIMVFVPIAVMTILSLPPLTSMFVDRYILYSVVTVWILFGVVTVLTKSDILRFGMSILVIIVAVYGAFFVMNREPKGYISEILAETFVAADEKEPIIMGGVWDYYDGIFYNSERHPIYIFEDSFEYEYGSLEPIRKFRVNLIDNKEEFLKNYESVWYILSNPEKGEEYEIPDWAKEMRITSEISLDHHTALRFTKD